MRTTFLVLCIGTCFSIPIYAETTEAQPEETIYTAPQVQKKAEESIFPPDPLTRVEKTKEPPVNTTIRYKKAKHMSYDEAHQARLFYLWDKNIESAIKAVERILLLEDDQNKHAQYLVEYADLHYCKGDYTTAETIYDTFADLYPGSPYLEYTYYKSLSCHYYNMLPPDKDQDETRRMIASAQNYIDTFGTNARYAQKAQELRNYGNRILCLSELDVVDFYIKKYAYATSPSSLRSAYYRLQHIYKSLSDALPSKQAHQVQAILAKAMRTVEIDTLDDENTEQNDTIYQKLYDTSVQLHTVLDEQKQSWWSSLKSLHRF